MHERSVKATLLGLLLAAGGHTAAQAGPVAFTWDPSKAIPALTGSPDAFTADAIQVKNYIRTTNTTDLTTLKQSFAGDQFQMITGFTLGNSPVAVPGLNSTFGLYFHITPAGAFPINGSGLTIGPPTYSTLDVTLLADVGNDDGTLSSTATGIGFSNPAGVGNDVTLASGHLITASLARDPQGNRKAHYLTTFAPAPGEASFFAAPGIALDWEEFLSTPAVAFSAVQVDPLTVLNIADGNLGSQGFAQLVPEPAAMGLVIAGLFGLGLVRRRVSK